MNQRAFLSIILLTGVTISSFCQTTQKIYYNIEWKGCSKKNASYYRVVAFDSKGKPVGRVNDYYITGQLQGKADGALVINKQNDDNSVFIGTSTGYYKSGNKMFFNVYSQTGEPMSNKAWYENGNKKYVANYNNGELNGLFQKYFDNGLLESEMSYFNGTVIGVVKYFNKFGKISVELPSINGKPDYINQKIYYYNDEGILVCYLIGSEDENRNMTGKFITFNSSQDTVIAFMNDCKPKDLRPDWSISILNSQNKKPVAFFNDEFNSIVNSAWTLSNNENANVNIYGGSLNIQFYSTKSFRKVPLIQSPMDLLYNDFEVKTVVAKESTTFYEGIIFGYKDSKNYCSITFSKLAKVAIFMRIENGIILTSETAEGIHILDDVDNQVRVIKKNNKIKCFFNGVEGYVIDNPILSGNLVGLCGSAVVPGQKSIFKSFMVMIGEQPSAGFEDDDKNIVNLKMSGGVFSVPVELNGVLKIDFIFDSGASEVSISPDVAMTLVRTGTIKSQDWLPGKYYQFADGSIAKSARFKLKSIKIGNTIVNNVECSISNSIEAPMLLGQSVLGRFGKYTFDNQKKILILD